LARAVGAETGHQLHHHTVQSLLHRYFFWKYAEFRDRVTYPVPADPEARRFEMARLCAAGWNEKTIAQLLRCSQKTVIKWLRRWAEESQRQEASAAWARDRSHARHHVERRVSLGTFHAVLQIQKRYGYAGWFRVQGYLEKDYGIRLGETTIKKIMRLNRKLHLAPARPVEISTKESREGPPQSKHAFEHCYLDIRYLDAKPGGVQLYSTLVLEGYSRTILAGSLTRRQDVGVVLRVYYLALLWWGCWWTIISDHGGQFKSHAFDRVNRRLLIQHEPYEKGHPWENLIEAQFGIQARVGEYGWERCRNVEEAVELHRELIRDHNRLPHFAHRKRQDQKHSPLEVLDQAKGREVDAATLHRAFSRMTWKRTTDERGYVRINRWRVYVEEGLPRTPVQVTYWDGKLRAEYESHLLTEYNCRWDQTRQRPKSIGHPHCLENPYVPRQQTLFNPLWIRHAIEEEPAPPRSQKRMVAGRRQLGLYLGPELVE
jgi:putative transposase